MFCQIPLNSFSSMMFMRCIQLTSWIYDLDALNA